MSKVRKQVALTKREQEIIFLMAETFSEKLATKFGLHADDVKVIQNLYDKFN